MSAGASAPALPSSPCACRASFDAPAPASGRLGMLQDLRSERGEVLAPVSLWVEAEHRFAADLRLVDRLALADHRREQVCAHRFELLLDVLVGRSVAGIEGVAQDHVRAARVLADFADRGE